jgi:hypothetical protein
MGKQFINPPQLYKHPAYSRVVTVKGPCKFIFIAGQTPSGDNYEPMAKGDYKKQDERVIEGLMIQLKATGAAWDRRGGARRLHRRCRKAAGGDARPLDQAAGEQRASALPAP